MAQSQFRSKRKVSGKKYIPLRKKRLCDLGGITNVTHIGERRAKVRRVRGGNVKKTVLVDTFVFVNDKNKTTKLKINGVENNPANIHYTRRNIITKGAIVKTDKGNVRVTSRPGQAGNLYGIFVN